MKSDAIIEVKDLSIRYYSMQPISYRELASSLFQRGAGARKAFTAVKGVSFSVMGGETVGIIGENGSGKSTLLRAIAGIYTPDEGEIVRNCGAISLLALGVGFQSRMSGYQNIFLSGFAMGATKAEIASRIDEIIAFSELEGFIGRPVQTYSSGMYSKLAFSISAFLSNSVVLIDEVLSVGDMRFQRKSEAKIREIIDDRDRSVIIVSHSHDALRKLCDKVVWLKGGELVMFGDKNEVIDSYVNFMSR